MSVAPEILRRFQALSALDDDELRQMSPSLERFVYKGGAQICREGDAGDCCYFLLAGSVSVSRNLPDGRRVRLATLAAGTLLGQSGLVPGQKRTADVKAEGEVELLTLSQKSLEWGLGRGMPWAVAVQAIVAVNLVRQLRGALDKLAELAAAEDPSLLAEGKTRAEIPRPIGLEVSLGRRSDTAARLSPVFADAATRAPIPEPAPEREPEPLPPLESAHSDLMAMLRHTEAGLAAAGLDLDAVSFELDEDQVRTRDARMAARARPG